MMTFTSWTNECLSQICNQQSLCRKRQSGLKNHNTETSSLLLGGCRRRKRRKGRIRRRRRLKEEKVEVKEEEDKKETGRGRVKRRRREEGRREMTKSPKTLQKYEGIVKASVSKLESKTPQPTIGRADCNTSHVFQRL